MTIPSFEMYRVFKELKRSIESLEKSGLRFDPLVDIWIAEIGFLAKLLAKSYFKARVNNINEVEGTGKKSKD